MWVMDIPEPASKISAGMPVCTVKASANSIEQAKSLVQARAIEMQRVFLN